MSDLKNEDIYPKVGISIMVIKDGKVLLGKRKGSHGSGLFALPGGSLEYMETISDCIHRELLEETGIRTNNVRFIRMYNLREYAPKHFLDIAMMVDWVSGEPTVREPDKCESWDWYGLDNLPEPMFTTLPELFECVKSGEVYLES